MPFSTVGPPSIQRNEEARLAGRHGQGSERVEDRRLRLLPVAWTRVPAGAWAHIVNYRCPEGRLKLGFNNEPPDENRVTRGDWAVISGTGSFERASGSGQLKVQWDDDGYRRGNETYTGTITR